MMSRGYLTDTEFEHLEPRPPPRRPGPVSLFMSSTPADSAVRVERKPVTATSQARPTAAQLGLNQLAWLLISVQLILLAATCYLFPVLGLSIAWPTVSLYATAITMFSLAWLCHFLWPGSSREWALAEAMLVACLLLALTYVVAPAQYAAIALKRPLIDPWLAAADSALGVHVPALAEWTRQHSMISRMLNLAYITIGPQLFLPVIVLGIFKKERAALWEYCFHFHFCLVVTLLALGLFPAACAFNYYGFESTLEQTRFTTHFVGVRAGTFSVIRFNDMEGLISMPSFHVAAGLMVTWAFRQFRVWLAVLVGLNTLMIAATFMSGAHYFIDVIATLVLFLASIGVYRMWGAALAAERSAS
jgi:PAP2 superfamily